LLRLPPPRRLRKQGAYYETLKTRPKTAHCIQPTPFGLLSRCAAVGKQRQVVKRLSFVVGLLVFLVFCKKIKEKLKKKRKKIFYPKQNCNFALPKRFEDVLNRFCTSQNNLILSYEKN
jgi:hypothetical protein